MSFIIAIETSSSDYEIALGHEGQILYSSADHEGLNTTKDLGLLLRTGLEEAGCKIEDAAVITVNIGPGGLGAVRSGVSFANGLSYGLGIPLLPLHAFELVGFKVSKKGDVPVLITSNAADGHAYGGLYHEGDTQHFRYGKLSDIARELCAGAPDILVAGTHQDQLFSQLSDVKVEKSGIKFACANTHIKFVSNHDIDTRLSREPAAALNELSELFDSGKGAS